MVQIYFGLTDENSNHITIDMSSKEEAEKLWLHLGKKLIKVNSQTVRDFVQNYITNYTQSKDLT